MSGGPGPLPYYCPTLRASFFKAPCAGQVAAAKKRRQTFPGAVMHYGLEQCLQYGGRDLVRGEKACIPPDEENQQVESSLIEEVIPPNENNSPENGLDIPLEKNHHEVFMECSGDMRPAATLIPAAVRGLIKGQYCKHHPEVEAKVNKNGQFMGLCLECLQARAAANSRNRGQGKLKEKMTPAVARDLSKAGVGENLNEPAFSSPLTKWVAPPELKPQDLKPLHPCPRHPGNERHRDEWGVLMSYCRECYLTQRRQNLVPGQGNKSGNTVLVWKNRHAELRAWIMAQAEEYECSPAERIIYLLKQAMRAAG